jgi:hypothetical protein
MTSSTNKKSIKWILVILAVLVVLFIGYKYYGGEMLERVGVSEDETLVPSIKFNQKASIFNQDVSVLALGVDKVGYYLRLSPNDRYMMWGGLTDNPEEPVNKFFVTDLMSDETWQIPGMPINTWDIDNLLITVTETGIVLNDLEKRTSEEVRESEIFFSGSVSPDGKKFAYNTNKGIRVLDLVTKKIDAVSAKQYDGAYAWLSDSVRILGYKENSKDNLFEAGKGRLLAIWDRQTKLADTDLGIDMPSSALRSIKWITPDQVALVNAGYDDGSFDYIVDLPNKFVTDLGETSGMLMGGVKLDEDLSLIGMVGEEIDGPGELSPLNVAKIIDKTGATIHRKGFDDNYRREYVNIVDSNKVLYLRKGQMASSMTEVILLDFRNGTEKVLATLSDSANSLILSKDKKYWIVPNNGMIMVESL